MNLGPNQLKWIEELEMTVAKQGTGKLHKKENDVHSYCCLGIGCTVFNIPGIIDDNNSYVGLVVYMYGKNHNNAIAPVELRELIKFAAGAESTLMVLNDTNLSTFKEIAQKMRTNPADYFSEPC